MKSNKTWIRILFAIAVVIALIIMIMMIRACAIAQERGRVSLPPFEDWNNLDLPTYTEPVNPVEMIEKTHLKSGEKRIGNGVDVSIRGMGYYYIKNYGEKKRCYIIEVEFENHWSNPGEYSLSDFKLLDSEGYSYDADAMLQDDVVRGLGAFKVISPSSTLRGFIAFSDIPKNAVVSSVTTSVLDTPYGVWDISECQSSTNKVFDGYKQANNPPMQILRPGELKKDKNLAVAIKGWGYFTYSTNGEQCRVYSIEIGLKNCSDDNFDRSESSFFFTDSHGRTYTIPSDQHKNLFGLVKSPFVPYNISPNDVIHGNITSELLPKDAFITMAGFMISGEIFGVWDVSDNQEVKTLAASK